MESHCRQPASLSFRIKKKERDIDVSISDAFKKKQDSIWCGMGEEIYKPIWIFYDVMEAFLKTKYTWKSLLWTDEQSSSLSLDRKAGIGEPTEQETETPSDAKSNTETKDTNIKIPVQRRRSVRPPELDKAEKEMSQAFNMLNQALLNNNQQNKIEDDCDLYGRLLANKLRKYSESERRNHV